MTDDSVYTRCVALDASAVLNERLTGDELLQVADVRQLPKTSVRSWSKAAFKSM
ncbi:hypothetical protein [Pseudomonas sp. H1_A05]